jgi:hypothetical protein
MSGYTPDATTYQAAVDSGWRFIQKRFAVRLSREPFERS